CTLESITGQLVRFIGLIDEAGHGKTRGDVRHRDARAINETPIDVRAVAELRQVALSFGEYFEERTAWWFDLQFAEKIHHAPRVFQILHCLDAGDVVKEPTATRVHRQGTALKFQQRQRAYLFLFT